VNNALVLVIGSGVGGAVIIEKKIVKGTHLFGGEFGYMQLNEQHTFSQAASPVHHARRYSLKKELATEISGEQLFERAEGES
jgi:predicted NBD/HSP70 family sugar kinase